MIYIKNVLFVFLFFTFFSCAKKDVYLPEVDSTIIEKVQNLSPVYVFLEINGNDTIADLNRKNAISSTNFVFNIDKRLPLKLVIPEVIKVQKKKDASAYKDSTSNNYFSYSDVKKKQLAFLPFTKVNYKLENPNIGNKIYFKKNQLFINDSLIEKEKLDVYFSTLTNDISDKYVFCFDKNLSYGEYIKIKVFLNNPKFSKMLSHIKNEEFVY